MSGYAPPTAIPAGSIVNTATVRVTHGNTKKYVAPDKLTLTFTPKGVTGSPPASAITLTPTLPNKTSLVTDALDIYGGGTSVFDKFVHDNGFTGADMAYAATLTHKGTENLDAIQIDITYVTPAFRSEGINTIGSNCITQAYNGGSGGGCAVLSTSALASFTGAFYVQGTTYTPIAAIDLTLNKATATGPAFRCYQPFAVDHGNRIIQLLRPGDRDSGRHHRRQQRADRLLDGVRLSGHHDIFL